MGVCVLFLFVIYAIGFDATRVAPSINDEIKLDTTHRLWFIAFAHDRNDSIVNKLAATVREE